MRLHIHLVAVAAALLHGAVAVHHHGKAKHRSKHHEKHHERQVHGHHAKHHAGTHSTATYEGMQHELDKMVEGNAAAETRLGDSARNLEEALLDIKLSNVTNSTLRGAPVKKLPGNLSASFKVQEGKLGELFSHLKSNIATFNKREGDQKKDSAAFAERIKKRLNEDKKKLKDPSLSKFDHDMLVNRTRTEEHELKFWNNGRSLQHDMFHSNLKLTHGLMSRVKSVMDAYKQVLKTGKLDPKLTQVLHEASASIKPKGDGLKLLQKEQRVDKDVRKIEKHLKIGAKLFQ